MLKRDKKCISLKNFLQNSKKKSALSFLFKTWNVFTFLFYSSFFLFFSFFSSFFSSLFSHSSTLFFFSFYFSSLFSSQLTNEKLYFSLLILLPHLHHCVVVREERTVRSSTTLKKSLFADYSY
jgi:hypothetical protein